MCPDNQEIAGKRKTGRTRKANIWLRAASIGPAHHLAEAEALTFAAQYRRLTARRGKKKAAVAHLHSIPCPRLRLPTAELPAGIRLSATPAAMREMQRSLKDTGLVMYDILSYYLQPKMDSDRAPFCAPGQGIVPLHQSLMRCRRIFRFYSNTTIGMTGIVDDALDEPRHGHHPPVHGGLLMSPSYPGWRSTRHCASPPQHGGHCTRLVTLAYIQLRLARRTSSSRCTCGRSMINVVTRLVLTGSSCPSGTSATPRLKYTRLRQSNSPAPLEYGNSD